MILPLDEKSKAANGLLVFVAKHPELRGGSGIENTVTAYNRWLESGGACPRGEDAFVFEMLEHLLGVPDEELSAMIKTELKFGGIKEADLAV